MLRSIRIHHSRLEDALRELKKIQETNPETVQIEIIKTNGEYHFLKLQGEDSQKSYIEELMTPFKEYTNPKNQKPTQ